MKGIQLKLVSILIVPLVSIILIVAVTLWEITNIDTRFNAITEAQQKTHILSQVLLSLQDASSSFGFSSNSGTADLQQVRNYEAQFNNATFELGLYSNLLLLGSESDEFKNLEGGEYYSLWQERNITKEVILPPKDSQGKESLEELLTIQKSFIEEARRSFALKKQLLTEDSEIANNELIVLSSEVQSAKENLSNLAKEIVNENDKIIAENTDSYRGLISQLYTQLFISAGFGIVTMMAVGLYFAHIWLNKPIKSLTKVASDISIGKLDASIDQKILDSKDEIGELAKAFDRTLVSLKLAMKVNNKTTPTDNSS